MGERGRVGWRARGELACARVRPSTLAYTAMPGNGQGVHHKHDCTALRQQQLLQRLVLPTSPGRGAAAAGPPAGRWAPHGPGPAPACRR